MSGDRDSGPARRQPGYPRTGGPGERGRAARQRDLEAMERDGEAGRRDLRDEIRDKLLGDDLCGDERELSRSAREEARRDREASAEDRARSAHDRQVADFERRGRYG